MIVIVIVGVVVRMGVVMWMAMRQHGDGRTVVAAPAGCAHAQLTSIERIFKSRPAVTSTSALPQGHNKIRSFSSKLVSQRAASCLAGTHVDLEAGAVGDGALGGEFEAERHRIGDDGAQRTDFQLDAVHPTACGVFAHRIDNTLRQRHLVHVCPDLAG